MHLAAGEDTRRRRALRRPPDLVVLDRARHPPGRLLAEWPPMLKRFLDGTTQLSVVEHVSGARGVRRGGAPRHQGRAGSPSSTPTGRPLGIDKSNRISTMFDTRDPEHVKPLLDSTEQVLAALHEAGVEAFPAYGTLLGAIREQDFIGHDNDVDLGYVSRHTHPLDVIRESFRLQRDAARAGLRRRPLQRRRVQGRRGRGRRRRARARRLRRLLPRRAALPDGRDRHARSRRSGSSRWAPARSPAARCRRPPGPRSCSRRRTDPAGRCPTRPSTSRPRARRTAGSTAGSAAAGSCATSGTGGSARCARRCRRCAPSPLARHVAEQEPELAQLVDVGTGRGADALWFARRGVPTLGLDYAWGASNAVRRAAAEEGVALELGWMNLTRAPLGDGLGCPGGAVRRPDRGDGQPPARRRPTSAASRRSRGSRGWRCPAAAGSTPTSTRCAPDEDRYVPDGPDATGSGPSTPTASRATFEQAGAVIVHSTQVEATTGRREFAETDRPVARLVAEWRT